MAVDVSVRVAQLIKHNGMKIKWYGVYELKYCE